MGTDLTSFTPSERTISSKSRLFSLFSLD